jgi:hypothetical protein
MMAAAGSWGLGVKEAFNFQLPKSKEQREKRKRKEKEQQAGDELRSQMRLL